jgi:putative drug exporter of the RND superfamily
MLIALARLAIAAPRRVIAAALLVMLGAAAVGLPVTQSLSSGGFRDPTSESWHASEVLAEDFGHGDMQLLIAVTDEDGAHSAAARSAAAQVVSQLEQLPYVATVQSAWTAPASAAPAMFSVDGTTGLIVAALTGGETGAQRHAAEIAAALPTFPDVTLTAGGEAMTYVQTIEQTGKDLLVMEIVAVPLSFVVLIWVFGGVLAASLPVAVGVFATVGSMAVLRAVTLATEVSVFALNLVLAMGLALAIDYTLLIVSRFRDEIAGGLDHDEALIRTMTTAGRTVLFSATTVALAMVAMVLFPMYFLKSFAYAGIAVVAFTAAAAVVITPAVLMLLGDRVGRPKRAHKPVEAMFWYRWTKTVMRQAIPIGLVVVTLLLLLGTPFLGIKWGYPDERLLPDPWSSRQLGDQLRTEFEINSVTDVIVVIPDAGALTPAGVADYATSLSSVPEVTSVSALTGTYVDGHRVGPPSAATGRAERSAFLTVHSAAPIYSPASETQLDRLHAVAAPAPVQFTGWAQINRDSAVAVTSRLPLVLTVMAVVTFGLLFLLTGSVVLPLKALLLNMLSLTAAFGALVWVFQDGHLGAFGTTATGTMVASVPVLLFCLAFGLSMDYEVFLLARIREYWLASGQTRVDNEESVALGLARTGRVVTAAAVLMAVTFASLMTAQVSVMRMFGVGVTLAVLMDATLVRMLLVPAFMRVLGRLNWWAPAPLARLHRRIGLRDTEEPSRPGVQLPVPAPAPAQ